MEDPRHDPVAVADLGERPRRVRHVDERAVDADVPRGRDPEDQAQGRVAERVGHGRLEVAAGGPRAPGARPSRAALPARRAAPATARRGARAGRRRRTTDGTQKAASREPVVRAERRRRDRRDRRTPRRPSSTAVAGRSALRHAGEAASTPRRPPRRPPRSRRRTRPAPPARCASVSDAEKSAKANGLLGQSARAAVRARHGRDDSAPARSSPQSRALGAADARRGRPAPPASAAGRRGATTTAPRRARQQRPGQRAEGEQGGPSSAVSPAGRSTRRRPDQRAEPALGPPLPGHEADERPARHQQPADGGGRHRAVEDGARRGDPDQRQRHARGQRGDPRDEQRGGRVLPGQGPLRSGLITRFGGCADSNPFVRSPARCAAPVGPFPPRRTISCPVSSGSSSRSSTSRMLVTLGLTTLRNGAHVPVLPGPVPAALLDRGRVHGAHGRRPGLRGAVQPPLSRGGRGGARARPAGRGSGGRGAERGPRCSSSSALSEVWMTSPPYLATRSRTFSGRVALAEDDERGAPRRQLLARASS